MQQTAPSIDTIRHSSRITLTGILVLVALYAASACLGIPQHGRDLLVASHTAHDNHSSSTVDHSHTNNDTHANEKNVTAKGVGSAQ